MNRSWGNSILRDGNEDLREVFYHVVLVGVPGMDVDVTLTTIMVLSGVVSVCLLALLLCTWSSSGRQTGLGIDLSYSGVLCYVFHRFCVFALL
jgi:hypothetical protein